MRSNEGRRLENGEGRGGGMGGGGKGEAEEKESQTKKVHHQMCALAIIVQLTTTPSVHLSPGARNLLNSSSMSVSTSP